MDKQKIITYIALVISMIFWSFSFIWYKEVFVYLEPITTILLRLVISSVLLIIFTLSIKKLQLIKKSDIKIIVVLSFFQPLLYFVGESVGMKHVSATTGAVIISLIPLVTPLAAYYYFKDRLTYLNIVGLTISFIGVLFVILDVDLTFSASPFGLAFLMLAVFSAVAYSVVLFKVTGRYNVISIITWQNTIGIFMFLPIFFIFEYEEFKTVQFNYDVLLPLLELAVFASSIAFIFFTYGVKKIGVAKSSMFSNLIPAFTAIFAFLFLGDSLEMKVIIGIILVVFGLFLSQGKAKSLSK